MTLLDSRLHQLLHDKTYAEIAKATGVSQATVSRVFAGKRQASAEFLVKCVTAFNLRDRLAWLLLGEQSATAAAEPARMSPEFAATVDVLVASLATAVEALKSLRNGGSY